MAKSPILYRCIAAILVTVYPSLGDPRMGGHTNKLPPKVKHVESPSILHPSQDDSGTWMSYVGVITDSQYSHSILPGMIPGWIDESRVPYVGVIGDSHCTPSTLGWVG